MPDEKPLDVTAHSRVIKTRPVTFTCAECGQVVTEELYPGPAPRYCNDCLREVRRRQNAARQRAWRDRQQKQRQA